MLQELTECSTAQAQAALATADGKVKLAVLLVHGLTRTEAERLLAHHGGNLRAALQEHG
jgi:N-acetylmuramic acid 6-phosphate etherase